MKFVLSLSALLLSFSVQAEVKLPGTIMESQCADARELRPMMGGFMMTGVCTGRIVGKTGTYLFVKESRVFSGGSIGQTTIWEMTKSGKGYSVKEVGFADADRKFSEKTATSEVTGQIKTQLAPGTTTIEKMTGNLAGRAFEAEGFRTIFHTM